MSRSSGRRGQTEPLAALVAVFVLGTALAGYAVVANSVRPTAEDRDRDVAITVANDVEDGVRAGSLVDPAGLTEDVTATRSGYEVRVTLRTERRSWQAGPRAPEDAAAVSRQVSVRRWPGEVVPGTLRVEVWS
jgi:hypothetical protein